MNLSNRLQPTNRHNPCPVCGDISGDCRTTDQDLVLCHSHIDKYQDPNHPDYQQLKPSKCGTWGVFRVRTNEDFDREKWEREKAERERERDRYREAISHATLSVGSKDKDIRAILGQLTLTDADRDRLHRRGFTDAQINKIGYVSVKQWQPIQGNIRYGVNRRGNLNNPCDGILCPIRNRKGQLIALRLHNHGHKENGLPKYLSFKGSNLKSGEFPIAVYGQNLASGVVGITEGLEFKPARASYRLGIPVIGHNGTTFASSPLQTIETLRGLGASIVRLYPDGGVVGNPGLVAQYQKAIALYQSWGYLVEIAWWGQVTKGNTDIDEITQGKIDSIKYLDPQTFLDIVNIEQWKKKIEEKQHKLNTLSYKADILINQPKFQTLTELQQIKPLLTEGILTILGATGSGKSTLIKALKQLWLDQGKDIISIVPRIALGREQAHQWDIIWIGDMGVEKVSIDLMAENTKAMGLCFNSLKRLKNKDFSNAVILFDESELTCSDLVTARTIKDERSLILSILETKLKEALNGNGLIVLSDAHLTDVSVDYFKTLCPDAPIFTIINEAKPERWEIDFYTGKTPDAVLQEMYEDINNNLRVILAVDNQEKAEAYHRDLAKKYPDKIIDRVDRTFTEIQEGKDYVENLNLSILNRQTDILIHTGSMGTGCSIDGKHYDKELKKTLYFPEVYDHFDKVYGLFFGVVPSNQIRQYLARYRKPVPRVIWCKEFGYADESLKSFDPDVIKRTIFKNKKMSSEIIDFAVSLAKESLSDESTPMDFVKALAELIGQDGTWDNPHMDLFCKIKARNNYNLSQLSIQLRQELIDDGHNLVDYCSGSGNNFTDEIKDEQEEIRREKATAIATATDITLEQAKVIERKATTSEGERNQVDKAYLKAELPGLELTPDFVFDWVISDRRKALNQTKLFFYVQNPDVAKYLEDREWKAKLRQFANGVAFLPDIKTYAPMVKVINDLRFFDLIDLNNPDREYRETDDDVIEFMKRAYFMRYKIHPALGLTVKDKTHPAKFIKAIGRKLGLDFTEKQKRDGEKRYRTFKLNTEILNDPTRLEILESLTYKYAEVLTLSSVECVTDHDFIFNKKEQCVTEFLTPDLDNSHDFPLVESHQVAPPNTEIDPFANYQIGDRVLLWHPFNGQWQPATIQRVVSGFNGFVHALGDNGLGDSITRHKLSQLAPMKGERVCA